MKIQAALVLQNCIAGAFEPNLQSTLYFIEQAHQKNAKLIIFPEMNLTGYASGDRLYQISQPVTPNIIALFSKLCGKKDLTIIVGLAERSENGDVFASHLVFSSTGYKGKYQKIHTAPNEKQSLTPEQPYLCFQDQQTHLWCTALL